MQTADYDARRVDAVMRVRQNAAPAAVGAVFLLYFGFFQLAEPTGTGLFDRASWVFYHTLRVGGVAMAVVALWSLAGQAVTLAIDAVVTELRRLAVRAANLGLEHYEAIAHHLKGEPVGDEGAFKKRTARPGGGGRGGKPGGRKGGEKRGGPRRSKATYAGSV